jgi:hypothetical protein
VSCHAQPAPGGTSPAINPQIAAASDDGASNSIPDFISASSPAREARFPFLVNPDGTLSTTADGHVHDLFTITGRADAPGCEMAQPNFVQAQELNNIIFRIPTPLFGAGLIENIPDTTIYANLAANAALKKSLGISGHANTSGNDGTVTRFGWKAQNKSVEVFAGEAYNVEIGVTNELFPNERGLPPTSSSTRCPKTARIFRYPAIRSLATSWSSPPSCAFSRLQNRPRRASRETLPGNPSPAARRSLIRFTAPCATLQACKQELPPSPQG